MVTKDGVIARFILTFCLFYLSGSQILTGWAGATCGIVGTAFLVSALMRYSPIYELYDIIIEARIRKKQTKTALNTNDDTSPSIIDKNKTPA